MKRPVAGFLFRSDVDSEHDNTVCRILDRAEPFDEGFGIHPMFLVKFNDGAIRAVMAIQLSPWYPV